MMINKLKCYSLRFVRSFISVCICLAMSTEWDPKLWPITFLITLVLFSPCICIVCRFLCKFERCDHTDPVTVELKCVDADDRVNANTTHHVTGFESFGDIIRLWKGGLEGVLNYPVAVNQRVMVHVWKPQTVWSGRVPHQVGQGEPVMNYATRENGRWTVTVTFVRVTN